MTAAPLYLLMTGAVAGAIGLVFAIPSLLRRVRIDSLATLPVAPEHRVELPAGDVVLHLAGPLGTTALGVLFFELVGNAGEPVPQSNVLVRSSRSSMLGDVMVAVRRFRVPADGAYRLDVSGIPAGRDVSACRLVLARSRGGVALAIVAVALAAVTLLVCGVLSLVLLLSPPVIAAPAGAVPSATTPPRGSSERRAVLDAVRTRAGLDAPASRLRVHHLKVAGGWAYFAGNGVVRVDRSEWQETDLSIDALLERDGAGWRIVEYWSLPHDRREPRSDFERRLAHRRAAERIPAAIFPHSQ